MQKLQTANPSDWSVSSDWADLVHQFFTSDDGRKLISFLESRLAQGAVIYPPQPLRALLLTPLESVHTVILGQDPYHGPGQAEGLAFSVAPGVPVPPTLRNILKERQRDLGLAPPDFPQPGGSLVDWAKNGVLLLNSCLTVEDGLPASHAKRGWEVFTDRVIAHISRTAKPTVFMLWGAYAQSKRPLINEAQHLVLAANHPSPLSALRPPVPFLGCGHFSRALDWQRTKR